MKCDDCIHNIQRVTGKLDCECKLDPRVPWVMNEKTKCCLFKEAEQICYTHCRCFRCGKPLGEVSVGILLMYPARYEGQTSIYTIPRMHCNDCIQSFYKWSNGKETKGAEE